MPAYLISLDQHCDEPTCLRRATVALYNGVNAIVGHYCNQHGNAALAWYCDQHGKAALASQREIEAKA